MKRKALIKHLSAHGCQLHREGGEHTIYLNPATKQKQSVPRHTEIAAFLTRKICDGLNVPRMPGN